MKRSNGNFYKIGFWVLIVIVGLIVLITFGGINLLKQEVEEEYNLASWLEGKGYEVIEYGYADSQELGLSIEMRFPYIKMKALGNRLEQIHDVLIDMSVKYGDKNNTHYQITIFTDTQECLYILNGNLVDNFMTALDEGSVTTVENKTFSYYEVKDVLDYTIEEVEDCK